MVAKLFAMVFLALVGPAPADSPKQLQLKPGDQIVAIGDLITAGGGYLRAFNGGAGPAVSRLEDPPRRSTWASAARKPRAPVARFDKDVVERKPAFVTISIGINDVWHRLGKPHDEKVWRPTGKTWSAWSMRHRRRASRSSC